MTAGQDAGNGPQPPVEPELAQVDRRRDGGGIHRPSVASEAIAIATSKPEPCLGRLAGDRLTVSRRRGQRQPAVGARVVHALHRLAERLVGQADDLELGVCFDRSASTSTSSPSTPDERDRPRARDGQAPPRPTRCSSAAGRGVGPGESDRVDAQPAALHLRRGARPSTPPRAATAAALARVDRLERVPEAARRAGSSPRRRRVRGTVADDEVELALAASASCGRARA